eukprot:3207936-Rhodomonas_salina.1
MEDPDFVVVLGLQAVDLRVEFAMKAIEFCHLPFLQGTDACLEFALQAVKVGLVPALHAIQFSSEFCVVVDQSIQLLSDGHQRTRPRSPIVTLFDGLFLHATD